MLLAFQIFLAIVLIGLFLWLNSFLRKDDLSAKEKRGRLLENIRYLTRQDRLATNRESATPVE